MCQVMKELIIELVRIQDTLLATPPSNTLTTIVYSTKDTLKMKEIEVEFEEKKYWSWISSWGVKMKRS